MIDINVPFEIRKVERAIQRQGKEYIFRKQTANEFKEKTDSGETITIAGLFHQKYINEYVEGLAGESGNNERRSMTAILTLWKSLNGLEKDDKVDINGKIYKVIGINNIQEQNVIADISLEAVQ